MDDRIGMSISADSPLDETLNRGPLALLLQRQYEIPFGINIVQFSICLYCIDLGLAGVRLYLLVSERTRIQLSTSVRHRRSQ